MLRFLETIGAAITNAPPPAFENRPYRHVRRRPMAGWLIRFLIEHHLHYVRPSEADPCPGVAWLMLPSEQGSALHERARADCGSFAAWLAAATCTAICQQQRTPAGRVLLNLPIRRDNLQRFEGFGFGVGSLLLPVNLDPAESLSTTACRIFARFKTMIDQGWHENFERLLGRAPARHLRFAALDARGRSAPIVNVSWKGAHWRLGADDAIRDVACFAVSPVVHVSGHIDRNGLSVSITSNQSTAARKDLLRRIVAGIGGGPVERVLMFDGHSQATARAELDPAEGVAI
jgi:hypothetical protein